MSTKTILIIAVLVIGLFLFSSWASTPAEEQQQVIIADEDSLPPLSLIGLTAAEIQIMDNVRVQSGPYEDLTGDDAWGGFAYALNSRGVNYEAKHRQVLAFFKGINVKPDAYTVGVLIDHIKKYLASALATDVNVVSLGQYLA